MAVITAITAAAAVVGAGAAIKGASDSKKAAGRAADNSREVALAQGAEFRRGGEREMEIARFDSQQIRRAALEKRGEQIATAAHNGILVGDGTAEGMVAKTMRLAKQDIYVTLDNAEKVKANLEIKANDAERSGQVQAGVYEAQGDAAIARGIGGVANAATALANIKW